MRVSDDALQRHIQILRDMGSPESQGVLPASLQMRLEVALDLYEARQHIAEIEQALTSSQTTSRHYYAKLTANNEAASKRIAELEAQLAEARRDGERWRWWMADYKRDIAGLFDGVAQGWTKAQWDEFVDGKIAAAAAEGEKG